MKFFQQEHRFDRPWAFVTLAAWNKYPNDNCPQVVNVDILDRHVDPATGLLHTERLFTCKQNLPSILEWIVGKDAVCYVRETTTVDLVNKTMVMRAKNLTYSNLLTVEEICTYSEHVPNESTTRFTQQAIFSACGFQFSSIQRKIEETCVVNFAKNADRGRQAMEQVMDHIVNGTINLGCSIKDMLHQDQQVRSH